jgi:hypothetical protein
MWIGWDHGEEIVGENGSAVRVEVPRKPLKDFTVVVVSERARARACGQDTDRTRRTGAAESSGTCRTRVEWPVEWPDYQSPLVLTYLGRVSHRGSESH